MCRSRGHFLVYVHNSACIINFAGTIFMCRSQVHYLVHDRNSSCFINLLADAILMHRSQVHSSLALSPLCMPIQTIETQFMRSNVGYSYPDHGHQCRPYFSSQVHAHRCRPQLSSSCIRMWAIIVQFTCIIVGRDYHCCSSSQTGVNVMPAS